MHSNQSIGLGSRRPKAATLFRVSNKTGFEL
jgi:hypothetical protein